MASGQFRKQDVSLIFGLQGGGSLSGESGKLIESQLNNIVKGLNSRGNIAKRRIVMTLDVANTKSNLKKELEEKVLKNFGSKQFKVTLSKIDASSAIKNVKDQLKEALNALSIKNGVSVEELVKFTGYENGTKGIAAFANSMEEAATSAAHAVANVKSLKALSKAVDSSVESAVNGKNSLDELDEMVSVLSLYKEWVAKVSEVTANPIKYTSNYVDELEKEGILLQGLIADLQKEQAIRSKLNEQTEEQSAADREAKVQRDAQIKSLQELIKTLNALQKTAVSGKNAIEDPGELDSVITNIQSWMTKASSFIAGNSDDTLESLTKQGLAISNNIKLIQREQEARKKAAKETEKQAKAQEKLMSQAEKEALGGKISSYMSKNPNARGTAEYSMLQGFVNEIFSGDVLKSRGEQIKKVFDNITNSLKAANREGGSFEEWFSSVYKQMAAWSTIKNILQEIWQQAKKMAEVVKEIDTAMTELRKVTDETEETYAKFLENSAGRAKRLGAAISDTVSATADFARLGYDIEEAEVLADTAIIYKNVGDGINDISEASESIISTLQAFDIEAENAMQIVDKFNKTGNSFAISSKGVGDALLRSASALAAAGNNIDESIAMITATNEVVQSPEKVGNAMKVISMYLRSSKVELEEAGESTEGMAESVSKLRESLLGLTGGKLDIQIDDSSFKSTYDILKELSSIWDEISDIDRAGILELIGGKRNANVTAALIENFDTAEKALATSQNSTGSAIAENEKYKESIVGTLNEFKAAYEELATTVIDSDFLKGLIDLGTSLLELLNDIVDRFGTLATVVGAAGIYGTIAGKGSNMPCLAH